MFAFNLKSGEGHAFLLLDENWVLDNRSDEIVTYAEIGWPTMRTSSLPIWLGEEDIAALAEAHGVIVPKRPIHPGRADGEHWPQQVTGHIDFLRVRNGCPHILD